MARKSRKAKMGCGCASKGQMGFGKNGKLSVKVGSMKLLVTQLGTVLRASDEKYMGKLHVTGKGVYFLYHNKRVYLPERVAKALGKGSKSRKNKSSAHRKVKRKSRKSRKSRKRKSRKRRKSRKSRKRKSRKSRKRRKSRKSRKRRKSRKSRKSRKRKSRKRRKSRKSRKRRKSRKSRKRRKSRKSRKSRKRKSRKSKKVKQARGCNIQSGKKYVTRNSPPYPANECCGQRKAGNDGRMYVSKTDKNGVCHWKLE